MSTESRPGGGDIFAAWLITGETRSYNTVGGYFRAVSPARTVFDGGLGAWEVVLRMSYSDLDDGGYSKLDRFNVTGATQFFQSRPQLQL